MPNGDSSIPSYGVIALWAFLLNGVWEIVQCTFFYDMWEWPIWKAALWMLGATIGDVLIVLVLAAGVGCVARPATRRFWVALFIVGFMVAVALEWVALRFDLWRYSPAMPTVSWLGQSLGVAPLLQMTLLPALSVFFAERVTGHTRPSETSMPSRTTWRT